MKKLLAVVMCMIICLSLSGCNQYEYVSNAIDNFDVGYSEDSGDAFVSIYNCITHRLWQLSQSQSYQRSGEYMSMCYLQY